MTDRALSTPVAYVLNLAIAAVLLTGLVVGGTTFVDERGERVVRTELRVIGQHIAWDIQQADRMVQAQTSSTNPRLSVRQQYPRRVAGSGYTAVLRTTTNPTRQFVNLSSTHGDGVSVAVRVPTETDVSTGTSITGGAIEIVYADTDGDNTRDALVIRNAG